MNGYKLTDADRDRIGVAFHEAAHAVAAVALGGQVRKAVIGDKPRTEFVSCPGTIRPQVAYAGSWAQARWHTRGRRPTSRDIDLLFTVNTSDYRSLVAAGGAHVGHPVTPLLERCWPAICELSKTLYFKGEIGHDDVCAALGITDGGGPGSFELACIRAGLRSVGRSPS